MPKSQKTSKLGSFMGGVFVSIILGELLFMLMMMLTSTSMNSHLCDPDPFTFNIAFVGVIALVFGLLMAMVGKGSESSSDIYFGFGVAFVGAISICVPLYWMLTYYGQIFIIPICQVR